MALVGVFAGLALVFALVGLYAVVSHSVAERVREMGVRLALGASPAGLLRLVLFESLRLVGAGVAIGIGLALGAMQFLSALLFGVSAHDPATFLAIPLVLFAAATLGCLVPARRAMRVDPMVTLRAD
jgi:ABC-type antimicrobial peptide transport system permease subunit